MKRDKKVFCEPTSNRRTDRFDYLVFWAPRYVVALVSQVNKGKYRNVFVPCLFLSFPFYISFRLGKAFHQPVNVGRQITYGNTALPLATDLHKNLQTPRPRLEKPLRTTLVTPTQKKKYLSHWLTPTQKKKPLNTTCG